MIGFILRKCQKTHKCGNWEKIIVKRDSNEQLGETVNAWVTARDHGGLIAGTDLLDDFVQKLDNILKVNSTAVMSRNEKLILVTKKEFNLQWPGSECCKKIFLNQFLKTHGDFNRKILANQLGDSKNVTLRQALRHYAVAKQNGTPLKKRLRQRD